MIWFDKTVNHFPRTYKLRKSWAPFPACGKYHQPLTTLHIDVLKFAQPRANKIIGLGETPDKTTALRIYLKQMEVLKGFDDIDEVAKSAFELGHDDHKLVRIATDCTHLTLQHDSPPGKKVFTLFLAFDQQQANSGIGY